MVFRLLFFTFAIVSLHASPGYYTPWGKDSDLHIEGKTLSTPSKGRNPLSSAADTAILVYQNFISPTSCARSNFRPSSSRYTLLSIRRYGFFKGFIMGCDRLMRENKDPWIYETRIFDGKKYKFDPTIRYD